MPKNVVKHKARPDDSASRRGDDAGLWVDYELLRKQHHGPRGQQTIIHNPDRVTNNRYLELADYALGNIKAKKKGKSKSAGAG